MALISPESALADEPARLAALHGLALLDTLPEPVFDAITAAAAQACGAPIALVSLIDAKRQWFKSQLGLDGVTEMPREAAFCDHTIRGDALFEVGDATRDPRFAAHPLVAGDAGIRFYAGAPIVLPGGERIGTVCVIDRVPRTLDDTQRGMLASLARIASVTLVDRARPVGAADTPDIAEKTRLAAELDETLSRLTAVVDNVPAMLCQCDGGGIVRFVNREFQAAAGLPIDQIIGRPLSEVQQAVDPTGYQRLEPRLAEVMRGRRQEFEVGLLTTAGLRQFRTTLVPEAPRPGRPGGFFWMASDITGRKALELRLADSEQRYRSLFDYLNSGFALHEIVVDHEGKPVDYRFLAMNAAFTAMSGLDALSSLGRCVTELFPGIEADSADWIGVYGRVAQSGEPAHFEQHSAVLNRWFEVVAYRPAPGQFAVIAQDITERKSATAQLALSEQRLRLLVDAVHDHSMILLDVRGHIETWNVGAQRIKGYAADEIIGQHYRRLFDEAETRRGDPENQLAVATAYGRFANEGWRIRRDGSRFWAAVTVTAVRDPAGGLQGFVKVTRDLSDRQRRQELLHRVAELSPSAMLLFDPAGRIVFANARAEAMFGHSRDELVSGPSAQLLPTAAAPDAAAPLDFLGSVKARPADSEQALMLQRKNGSVFEAEVGLATFDTDVGRAALAVITDITERRRQQQRLQNALMEKETLLKEVYHRVKNNLQVVQSLLNLQRRGMADGPARTALGDSVQRVRAMALVHEKLYQSGNLAAVSLPDYTRDLLQQMSEAAGASQRNIVLEADVAARDIGLDNAIPYGLLVAELVGNSLKHGFPSGDGWVRVIVAPAGAAMLLTVADNGVGLPPGFEPTHRASMGLQLVTSLARQLGGEVHAENDGGARFHVLMTRLG